MPTTLIDDKVWWDRRHKLNGICEETQAASTTGDNVLVLAHFEATLSEIENTLRSRSFEIQRLAQINFTTVCSAITAKAWSGLARSVPALNPSAEDWGATRLRNVGANSSRRLHIIVAEHHPLRSRDEQLITSSAELNCEAQLTFHISLDDPLLTNFGVRSFQDLGRRLGIDEESFLSNPMITRAIRQGQEKIEREVPLDLPASSIEDWFKHNLPPK